MIKYGHYFPLKRRCLILKSSFFKGMRLSVPLALGFIPIGCSFAVMAMQAGLTGFETVFMSFFVLSGASQIMAVGMLSQGAGFAAIVLASAFMTMRHLVLSSSVMRRLGKLSTVQKIVGSYALCDESFAVFSLSEEKNFPFLMGCNTLFCATWISSTALGVVLNNFLPPIVADSCAIAFYAAFLAMLNQARQRFHYIFLDAPAGIDAGFRLAAQYADRIVLVTGADPAAVRDAARAGQLLDQMGKHNARLIVNRVAKKMVATMSVTVDDVMDDTGLPLLGIVPEDPNVIFAAACARPVAKFKKRTAAVKAYQRIANRIQGLPEPITLR